MRRVVITGMGAVTSCGMGVKPLWKQVLEGRHGFCTITGFDTSDFAVKYAAEISNWDPVAAGLNKKEARRMDRFSQFAMAAANLAMEQAGNFAADLDPFRIGVLVSSGIGGFHSFEEEKEKAMAKGVERVSVFFIPMMIPNMAGGLIAIQHGFKGENYCPVSACASSAHAVGEAFRKIKYGYLDACVTGGAEAAITQFALAGFYNMGALAVGEDPARLSIPFDKERKGFVMGEGAAVLVLEELEHAKRRGAEIVAEVVGYGATDDAYHITGPDPQGLGAAKAMELAMKEAGFDQVDYINAHGTSTEANDKIETLAIKMALGEESARKVAVSSTKGVTGHMLGAAGAVEAILTALALKEGVVPPTAGYQIPDEECDLDYVAEGARKKDIRRALSNSLGFGGHNATIAFQKYQG